MIRPTPTGPPCTSRPSGATTCAPRCPRYATPMAISKDQFSIDLQAGTVTCPAHHTVAIRDGLRHRSARFGATMWILSTAGGLHESPWRTGHQHPPP